MYCKLYRIYIYPLMRKKQFVARVGLYCQRISLAKYIDATMNSVLKVLIEKPKRKFCTENITVILPYNCSNVDLHFIFLHLRETYLTDCDECTF